MAHAHKCLQALLDIRQHHQVIDNGVWRFRGDDTGFGNPDITAITHPLLGMANRGAFHGAFHRARSAAGANIHAAQSELIAHLFGIVVFPGVDRVPSPADDQPRRRPQMQQAGVSQNMKNQVPYPAGGLHVGLIAAIKFARYENDVPQHGKQVILDAIEHPTIDKCTDRRVAHLQPDPARSLDDFDPEVRISLENLGCVIRFLAAIEHRQRAAAKQVIEFAVARFAQTAYLVLRQ